MTTITTDQKIQLTLNALTLGGKNASLDGVPLWSSSNVGVGSLVVAPNGLSAFVLGVSAGTTTVSVIADGDLTSAVRQLTTSIDVTVTQAGASSISLSPGTAVNQ